MSEPRAELEKVVESRRSNLSQYRREAAESIGWIVFNGAVGAYNLAEHRTGFALLSLASETWFVRDAIKSIMAASHESKVLVGLEQMLAQNAFQPASEPVFYDQDNPQLA